MDNFHFIGIKGCGMSALAQILSDLGHHVQGEDIESHLFTQVPLDSRNIPLYAFGDAPLKPNMTVIASNAYDDNHPSVLQCKELGIPVHRYHHFLGEWMKGYTSIAITGAHGKTTTTGMLVHALHAQEPPCSLIGDGTGKGNPDADLFVFESCEYRRHFLAYRPDIAVITNIDFDHPDYFADIDDVRQAFEEMASLTGKYIVACGDDPQVRLLRAHTDTLYYGFGMNNQLRASNLVVDSSGVTFDVYYKDTNIQQFKIPVFGKHNVLNALAVIGVALVLDRDMDLVKAQLATFSGVKRRFSEKQWGSNVVIDDYAHHPSEIRATLEAARSKYPSKRIVGIFQPHTFSRLEKLIDDFALSLKDADDVYLCQIFGSAREGNGSVSIGDLQSRIPNARLLSDNIAADMSTYNDSILVFMGAGDIQKYQDQLFQS
ncbi:UDP-N-acetylmuramate--L-alanine ligase [Paenibacillus spongiae]|uniref:UDP-N-acetylmuramate--L-alanine ligase n=1 Tax=Paenibacillus spongiae TaxID=2909671 RepID=A0ABY5SGP9_9BACL|nr:UDP-N-acetylmuramate--L-alanine ligase [Paenibacillus spongiae]UVI32944.1 UDP-N-acetylmuramate--L-alanine ligase [Paenibacillus spongiae]